ncbi:MAG: ABC transporter substrate-binding protein [Rhodoplanes sp.]|uniref:TAXI family TRAP transporter solute-binding subunit n=1 Tax=Rhodoplanes sp. TaxID=1968906 RepID=UPI0017DE4C5A|nr:TAXI family TRAP transporter solute-binding subunit [Rhodoplanes sp.]NVO16839.1 ABC transporter substrate-binding protein [Rhodoplanes sp.]
MPSPLRRIAATMVARDRLTGTRSGRTRRRLRLMLRQTPLILLLGVFIVTGLAGAVFYFNDRPSTLRIAVGPPGSEDARLVHAIAQQFGRERGSSVRLTPVIKEGPGAAARALQAREVDLAVVRRDVGYPVSGQAVVVLHDNIAVLVVPAEGSIAAGGPKPAPPPAATAQRRKRGGKAPPAPPPPPAPEKIDSIEDLAGRRIGLVGPGMGDREVLDAILRQYQVLPDKVTVVPLDPRDVATSLRNAPVDAILALGPVASPHVAAVIAASSNGRTGPTFLEIGASEAIAARSPVYEEAELKAGVFGGQTPQPPETVETIAFKHYIVARRSVPEDTIADLTRQLFAVRQTLSGEFPMAARIEKPDTDRDAAVPAHPGAAAYIDDEQKTFFDRYSDLIYLGVMAVSGIGSGLAWLAGHFRADTRVRRLKLLERLVGILRSAREAVSRDDLAQLDQEIDGILSEILLLGDRNALDQTSLAAYGLALDQARAAVAARRAALASGEDAPETATVAGPPARPDPAAGGTASGVTRLRIATTGPEGA